jgi:uncharacterized protein YcnI
LINSHQITIESPSAMMNLCAMALPAPVWCCALRVEVKEAVAVTMPEALAGWQLFLLRIEVDLSWEVNQLTL